MARSGEDRAHNDDSDDTHEHHADVGSKRQTECVGQTESLKWMTAGYPSPNSPTPPTKPA